MLVVCNGMPRSGSTLQYNIARLLLEKTGAGVGKGYFQRDQFKRNYDAFAGWGESDRLFLIKTHDAFPYEEEFHGREQIKTLYIYRDLRDVAVSLRKMFKLEGDKLFSALRRAVDTFDLISANDHALMQRYEEVFLDLEHATREVADYLGLEVGDDIVGEVASECSIESVSGNTDSAAQALVYFVKSTIAMVARFVKLNSILVKTGVPASVIASLRLLVTVKDNKTQMHRNHISDNKGGVGVWQEQLDVDTLAIVMSEFKEWFEENQ